MTDQGYTPGGEPPPGTTDDPDGDYGFQTAIQEPDQYSKGVAQDPLPPAGPRRARAPMLLVAHTRVGRTGNLAIGLRCPLNWPAGDPGCRGSATLDGARKAVAYDVAPGETKLLRFRLTKKRVAALRRSGSGDPHRHGHERRRRPRRRHPIRRRRHEAAADQEEGEEAQAPRLASAA